MFNIVLTSPNFPSILPPTTACRSACLRAPDPPERGYRGRSAHQALGATSVGNGSYQAKQSVNFVQITPSLSASLRCWPPWAVRFNTFETDQASASADVQAWQSAAVNSCIT